MDDALQYKHIGSSMVAVLHFALLADEGDACKVDVVVRTSQRCSFWRSHAGRAGEDESVAELFRFETLTMCPFQDPTRNINT